MPARSVRGIPRYAANTWREPAFRATVARFINSQGGWPAPANGLRMIGEIFVKHLGLIGTLSDEDRAALLSLRGEIRDVARGEDVLRQGERPSHSVVVISGLLQRYTLTPQGTRQIHSFYLPTDTPCLETLHIDVMDNALATLAPSRLGFVAHTDLLRVMEDSPKVMSLIWRETLVQAAIFRKWLMRNSQMLAHASMA